MAEDLPFLERVRSVGKMGAGFDILRIKLESWAQMLSNEVRLFGGRSPLLCQAVWTLDYLRYSPKDGSVANERIESPKVSRECRLRNASEAIDLCVRIPDSMDNPQLLLCAIPTHSLSM